MRLFSNRFTENIMAGAFFWTVELALLLIIPGQQLFTLADAALRSNVPDDFRGSILSISAVLGIVVVLVHGLLLDTPSWSTMVETELLDRYMCCNQGWLINWFKSCVTAFVTTSKPGPNIPPFIKAFQDFTSERAESLTIRNEWERNLIYVQIGRAH